METLNDSVTISYCNVDDLFYIRINEEDIHSQQTKPNDTDIIEALMSDNWAARFDEMREGKRVRVSNRIYYDMLCSVPPLKHTANSFFCGEAYIGSLHYYFEVDENNGKRYGQLKNIKHNGKIGK
jgi:hypothetical protein